MAKYVNNPPDATALMTSARSFGNYDLAAAIADLIDNSIKANATIVALTCRFDGGEPKVRILDDGDGMSPNELVVAMRPASANPTDEREPGDLGRFGWGLKSASFSQCRRLSVVTRRDGVISGACWDLADIAGWKMLVMSAEECAELASRDLLRGKGTEVIWTDCDRLSENSSLTHDDFNSLIARTRDQLALIFHRFLSGEAARRALAITLNGKKLPAVDPFCRRHDATIILEPETLFADTGEKIRIQPYILPHFSKLSGSPSESAEGEEGFLRNQGFYFYRADRLILYGTWFRLVRHGELSQLVRISIDVPTTLDAMWKLTLDKADAQLPAVLKTRLLQLVAGFRARSAKVIRSKGGQLDTERSVGVWQRFALHGEIRYLVNRQHPLVEAMIESSCPEGESTTAAALLAIEQNLPMGHFSTDLNLNFEAMNQAPASADEFRKFLAVALPPMLARSRGDRAALKRTLEKTEPFRTNWQTVLAFLNDEGWILE